ncbi:MAG: hypothetical protein CM1200mP39_16940 [Dehalococcoidia bacterium]|nr:MAG: hypothetical protein CM1200mP39_16940 [Dehalococcoidia bacterium]
MSTLTAPTIEDIREAKLTAGKHILRTPLRRYPILSELLDADVWVKHENFQLLGSFKARVAGSTSYHKRHKKRGKKDSSRHLPVTMVNLSLMHPKPSMLHAQSCFPKALIP